MSGVELAGRRGQCPAEPENGAAPMRGDLGLTQAGTLSLGWDTSGGTSASGSPHAQHIQQVKVEGSAWMTMHMSMGKK